MRTARGRGPSLTHDEMPEHGTPRRGWGASEGQLLSISPDERGQKQQSPALLASQKTALRLIPVDLALEMGKRQEQQGGVSQLAAGVGCDSKRSTNATRQV